MNTQSLIYMERRGILDASKAAEGINGHGIACERTRDRPWVGSADARRRSLVDVGVDPLSSSVYSYNLSIVSTTYSTHPKMGLLDHTRWLRRRPGVAYFASRMDELHLRNEQTRPAVSM